eukprot:TRINITY_DN88627_c0_g1_i1.p1 TRINITY_DN88627_c0_g1~~TRINITY_DN88627_c0_g1_i1.p1  ORF type:complete len:281 (-),score=43.62 TRINITY_DN88627_c0_g1_i1:96-821(-)
MASSFELVSQVFNGTISTHTSIPGVPSPPEPSLATAYIGLDMEKMSFREDSHIIVNMQQYNITAETQTSKVFDAATKRFTTYAATTTTGPAPSTQHSCLFYEFPDLAAPADVRKCIEEAASVVKPTGSESGFQTFEFRMPFDMQGTHSTVSEVIYTDASFIVKKIVADVNITSPVNSTSHTEMVDMSSKAGAPDSSLFKIPQEWGTCKETTMPAMPTPESATLQALLRCLGMGPRQSPIVV